jgi:hypothetical protein
MADLPRRETTAPGLVLHLPIKLDVDIQIQERASEEEKGFTFRAIEDMYLVGPVQQ